MNRKSIRVQFFQFSLDDDIQHVWVFRRANPDAVLGLLLDAGAEGVQVLMQKSDPLDKDRYQMIVHAEDAQETEFIVTEMRRVWSQPEGTLYHRHGFAFESSGGTPTLAEKLLAHFGTDCKWLRCELVPL